ncbi:hypothetical protein, partial [Anaerospora sp.]
FSGRLHVIQRTAGILLAIGGVLLFFD